MKKVKENGNREKILEGNKPSPASSDLYPPADSSSFGKQKLLIDCFLQQCSYHCLFFHL